MFVPLIDERVNWLFWVPNSLHQHKFSLFMWKTQFGYSRYVFVFFYLSCYLLLFTLSFIYICVYIVHVDCLFWLIILFVGILLANCSWKLLKEVSLQQKTWFRTPLTLYKRHSNIKCQIINKINFLGHVNTINKYFLTCTSIADKYELLFCP